MNDEQIKKGAEKMNDEQINILAAGAVLGFLEFWKNREIEFYKQLSKMSEK